MRKYLTSLGHQNSVFSLFFLYTNNLETITWQKKKKSYLCLDSAHTVESSTHFFLQQIAKKKLLCTQQYPSHWGYTSE